MREKGSFNPYFEVCNSPNLKNLINHTTRYQIVSYKSYFSSGNKQALQGIFSQEKNTA